MAPSFDHASSLGRELTDDARRRWLAAGQVGQYAEMGHGGIYWSANDRRGANPIDLVRLAATRYHDYFAPALRRAADLDLRAVRAILANVPAERISEPAIDFAHHFIEYALTELKSVTP